MTSPDTNFVPIISLVIAGLAVIVSPLISLYISKKQAESSLAIAKQELLGPMRQAWINDLRELIVDITSSCLHYWQTGDFDNVENEEIKRITHIENKLQLLINPNEQDHVTLFKAVKKMTSTFNASNNKEDKVFFEAYNTVISTAQKVLKQEWNAIKNT